MKKILKIFLDNSNTLLIFITTITLVLMIIISLDSSRKAGENLTGAIALYTDTLDTETPPEPGRVKDLLDQFSAEYFGWDKEKINMLLSDLKSSPETIGSRKLLQLISGYQLLITERLRSFGSLLYFLAAGVIIQFIFLAASNHRARMTGKKLRNSEEVLKLLSSEREKERLRISSFLHDSVLQDIGSLLLTPGMNENKPDSDRLRKISADLREMTYQIAPLQLNTAGLKDALLELSADAEKRFGFKAACTINGFEESFLDTDSRLVFYRVAQEALTNAGKHADAGHVQLKLVASHPYLIMRIIDNGRGFLNESGVRKENGIKHIGMILMREKAKSIGASLSGESSPGRGVTLTLKYRYKKADGR